MNITYVWRYQQEKYTKTIANRRYKPERKEKVLIKSDWYDGPSHYGVVTDIRWEYDRAYESFVTVYLDHSETYEEIF